MKMRVEGVPKTSKRIWRWAVPVLVLIIVILAVATRSREKQGGIATFATRRGPLSITVLQGGSVRAVDSQEIKCEVRVGYQGVKILKIVDEGYEVTADDIRTNKVLVELDSSDIQKQIVEKEIAFESSAASLTDAQQNYEIQVNQNLSDIKAAEQKVRFARMDFDKFLGDTVTEVIVAKLGIEQELAADLTNALAQAEDLSRMATKVLPLSPEKPAANSPETAALTAAPVPGGKGEVKVREAGLVVAAEGGSKAAGADAAKASGPSPGGGVKVAKSNSGPAADGGPGTDGGEKGPGESKSRDGGSAAIAQSPPVVIDFSQYANIDALGDGEAKQKLRKFQDDLQVAKKEEGQSQSNLEGTKRLFDKGFVTRIDLEKDEIAAENSRLKVQTAETARELFLEYEFSKTAEEGLSKYAEAARELIRARKAAISKLAQAKAKLKSAQGQYNIQTRQRKELYEQQEKCVIRATKPGLVVYGRGGDEMAFYGGEERVREGATVRERQSIITIPDMSKMSVRVKIHESYIRKVKKGQKAKITVDAFSDQVLDGEVTTVGVIPASQDMWLNPDMKVYLTTITINGTNDWLKPGMNAKVEILVNRLDNVLYVPIQAVSPFEGKQVCFVAGHGKPERRLVETGEFNDEFIEIKSGLKERELVLLRPAEALPESGPEKEETPANKEAAPGAKVPRKA